MCRLRTAFIIALLLLPALICAGENLNRKEDTAGPESASPQTSEILRKKAFEEEHPDFTFPARKKRYFYHGDRNSRLVALTFDDGPHPSYTPRLLALLREKKVPATFFLTGENAHYYPHIVREIVSSGCELGNHSYTHPNLRKLTPEKVREELARTQEQIKKASNVTPRVLRLPYGISSQDVARIAYKMKLDLFFWSLDTHDWEKKTSKQDIVKTVLEKTRGGSIILMHDKSQKVIDAVGELIDPLREKGFEFVTCSELADRLRLKQDREKKEKFTQKKQ